MADSLTPIQTALAEAFMGNTQAAKDFFSASPQTFDARLIALLQGLGQLDETLLAGAIAGSDLAGLLREIHATDQAARLAWIQSVKNYLLDPHRVATGSIDNPTTMEMRVAGGVDGSTDTMTIPVGAFGFGTIKVSEQRAAVGSLFHFNISSSLHDSPDIPGGVNREEYYFSFSFSVSIANNPLDPLLSFAQNLYDHGAARLTLASKVQTAFATPPDHLLQGPTYDATLHCDSLSSSPPSSILASMRLEGRAIAKGVNGYSNVLARTQFVGSGIHIG